jgi:hypothetical protein
LRNAVLGDTIARFCEMPASACRQNGIDNTGVQVADGDRLGT